MKDIKLTSVKVLESLYKRFKINTVNSNMTLQKITNRAINLYLNDNDFKDILDNTDELFISGSNF